jgi:hypothetical protein
MLFLSGYHVREMLAERNAGKTEAAVSLDLGLTKSKVLFHRESAEFPDAQRLNYRILDKMSAKPSDCFYVLENQAYGIRCYSGSSRRFYSLYATGLSSAPTVSVSGIRMHQTKNMDPIEDTLAKVGSVRIRGMVLDTCMGLGYTATYARKKGADEVVTMEKESLMMEIARLNPWSRQLFEDQRIEIVEGDSTTLVSALDDASFDAVLHDPPRLSLAGGLYSLQFYRELWRVLKIHGQLFHYVGDPGGRHRGRNIVAGVKKRLMDAGFSRVEECPKAQGVRAVK